jgi:hypothetical protein
MKARRFGLFLASAVASATLLMIASEVAAQPQKTTLDQFAGNYKGTAKMPSGEVPVTLEIKAVDGKVSGRAVSANNEYQITSGEIVGNKLALKFGAAPDEASLTLERKDDVLTGDWIRGTQKGTVELKKFDPTAKDEISGEWDAVADAQGQAFPFTLSLKLDGDKITGSSDSQLGHANIVSGSWKEGKLAIALDGNITLVATMVEGKLSGDYDYNGQGSGRWVAVRKK